MFPQILIVDDEPRIVKAVRLILSKRYQTISTGSIEEIETIITDNDIHLVLMDYDLNQHKNGIEIAEQIRDNHPLIQVLLFTGNTDYTIIKRAINSESIHAFINKPIMRDELIDVVGKHFEISLTKRTEFEETLQNIRNGTLSELDLTNFGYSKPLLNLLIKETIDVKQTSKPRLIGYNISTVDGTVAEDFIDDSIVIHNNFLFSKFVNTVLKLGNRLLEQDSVKLQEIDLEELKVVIKAKGEIVYSFFFINLNETSHSLNEMLIILIEEIGKIVPRNENKEKLEKRIGDTIFNWNF